MTSPGRFGLGRLSPARLLFLCTFLAFASMTAYWVADRRVVRGHDAFQYYTMQYYFLNNVVQSGEVPQWMPFMTQGTVSNWWHFISASFLQNVWLLVGRVLGRLYRPNFLTVFYLNFLFDQALFGLGTWLLSRRFFRFPLSAALVTALAVGSSPYFDQPWYNLHFFYALPLILHFCHLGLETAKWRYVFFASNLIALQCFGNLPYFPPMFGLIIFAYLVVHFFFFPNEAIVQLKSLLRRWPTGLLTAAGTACGLVCVYLALTSGTSEIVTYNPGRNPDGTVALDTFMTYGTGSSLKWMESFLRIPFALDYSLYFGVLPLSLIFLEILSGPSRRFLQLATIGGIVWLLSMSTFAAVIGYYLWPGTKYYRHLGLLAPFAKLFFCMLSGFGVERIIANDLPSRKRLLTLATGIGLVMARTLFFLRAKEWTSIFSDQLGFLPLFIHRLDAPTLERALWTAIGIQGIALILVLLLTRKRFVGPWLATLVVALSIIDVCHYWSYWATFKTVRLSPEQYAACEFQAMPFHLQRNSDYTENPRFKLFGDLILGTPESASYGSSYWSADSFLFQDAPGSMFKTEHFLRPFDDLLRTFGGDQVRDMSVPPPGFHQWANLEFPTGSAERLGGVSAPKLRFFKTAHSMASDDDIRATLADPRYKGDALFLSADSRGDPSPSYEDDESLEATFRVAAFDANNLVVEVDSSTDAWMFYSDVWHERWSATVNGRAEQVARANLGYKAVPIPSGRSVVRFHFGSWRLTIVFVLLGMNSLLWVMYVLCTLWREALGSGDYWSMGMSPPERLPAEERRSDGSSH
jgi:hypothetical protein